MPVWTKTWRGMDRQKLSVLSPGANSPPGLIKYVAGQSGPALHESRASSALYRAEDASLATVGANVPRANAFALNNATGLYERVTQLEPQRSNGSSTYSTDLSQAVWTKTGLNTPTMTATGPDGIVNSASTMIEDTSTGTHYVARSVNHTANVVQPYTFWVKVGNGTRQVIFQAANGSDSFGVLITPNTGAATPRVAGAGVLTAYKVTAGANGWYKIHIRGITNAAVTADVVQFYLYNAGPSYTGDGASGVYFYNAQPEVDGIIWSSDMPTGAAGFTRNADVAYLDLNGTALATPREQSWLIRGVELGNIIVSGVPWFIGKSDGTAPYLKVDVSGGFFRLTHHNGTASVTSAVAVAPAPNDQWELVPYMSATGAVRLTQSINGAALTSGALSADNTPASAWSDAKCYLGGVTGTVTLSALQEVAGLPGNYTLAQMRAF